MRPKIKNTRSGAALLAVLIVIMAITVLSLGYIARSDTELAVARNMEMRSQMDYLAESALVHAKGLPFIDNDYLSEYTVSNQQLVSGTNDYYDLDVDKLAPCNYRILVNAFRNDAGTKTGLSSLKAELRFDPCIGYYAGTSVSMPRWLSVYGDAYSDGNFGGSGYLYGDAFARNGSIGGITLVGRANSFVTAAPVAWPGITTAQYSSQYYYDGGGPYNVKILNSDRYDLVNPFPTPGANNPARIFYRAGNLTLENCNLDIQGTLVVRDKLTIRNGTFSITAQKNVPAIVAGSGMELDFFLRLNIQGLIVLYEKLYVRNDLYQGLINVLGAVYISGKQIEAEHLDFGQMNIVADPEKAAIEVWSATGLDSRWTPAAGAFFKRIVRP
jgi:hypothetical protein